MTSQKTSTEPPGYRGALPSREDRLARPWILLVIGIFVLVIVLSILGIPSRFIPEPTPVPLPSMPGELRISLAVRIGFCVRVGIGVSRGLRRRHRPRLRRRLLHNAEWAS